MKVSAFPAGGSGFEAFLVESAPGLPAKQRAAVALRYLADLSDDEIARILDCTPATVRSQLSRGLSSLRATMTAEG